MNEPKPMNEHCRLEHSDWNYIERSEDELCPVCRGEQMATERIIKLLPQIIEMGNVADVFDLQDFMPAIMRDAIALIKGEK